MSKERFKPEKLASIEEQIGATQAENLRKMVQEEIPYKAPRRVMATVNKPGLAIERTPPERRGEGEGPKKLEVKRTRYFGELMAKMDLEYDEIPTQDPSQAWRGANPYKIYFIPNLSKLVFISNAEQNITLVLHNVNLKTNYNTDDVSNYVGLTREQYAEIDTNRISWPQSIEDPDEQKRIWKESLKFELECESAWLTAKGMIKDPLIFRDSGWIKYNAEKIAKDHPEWARKVQVGTRTITRYSPSVRKMLHEIALPVSDVPEGGEWLNADQIVAILHEKGVDRKRSWVVAQMERAGRKHPEAVQRFKVRAKKPLIHINKEHLDDILTNAEQRGHIPEGWMSVSAISNRFHKNHDFVQRMLKKLVNKYPNEVRNYTANNDETTEYYGPSIVGAIRREIESKKAPEGWMPAGRISVLVDKTHRWVEKEADRLTKEKPDQKQQYEGESGHVVPHYGPTVVDAIKDIARSYGKPPEGWMSFKDILADLDGRSRTLVRKELSKYKDRFPDQYGKYGLRRKITYYGPIIVEALRKGLNPVENK